LFISITLWRFLKSISFNNFNSCLIRFSVCIKNRDSMNSLVGLPFSPLPVVLESSEMLFFYILISVLRLLNNVLVVWSFFDAYAFFTYELYIAKLTLKLFKSLSFPLL
jgi:hypothetical protein